MVTSRFSGIIGPHRYADPLTSHPGVFENAFLGTLEIVLARVRALGRGEFSTAESYAIGYRDRA